MTSAKSQKVLIVDNDQEFRVSLMKIFKKDGYQVVTSANGREATDLLHKEFFPLIILDLKMPGKNGLQLLQEIRQRSPGTRVIIVTAFGENENYLEAMNAGAFEFLHKPVKRQVILDCARRALQAS